MVFSEDRTCLDNVTKIQPSNTWISSRNEQNLYFQPVPGKGDGVTGKCNKRLSSE